MKKLLSKLPNFPHRDKIFHALGCFGITIVAALILPDALFGIKGLWAACGIAAIVGIGKEVWDAMGHGTPDVWDLVADGVGIAAAVALLMVL
ncbi:MAG: hypothetical protein COA96_10195 [SAR86 cluster bacterium]|uniref:VanZ-like domain-containing protein n=1 Tax=SAR86 cluster bacterium TaxID=2030880 RepID=A0A2A5AZ28_9GAMM|nr:MAG: hypothetical protein COA96_10195 [SAR86 cluster bacterium]